MLSLRTSEQNYNSENSSDSEQSSNSEQKLITTKFITYSNLPGLFSLRKPRHLTSGISSGLKNIFKGIGMGLGSIVIMPLNGAKEYGIGGFFGGLIGGVIGAGVLITTGAICGVVQGIRGILNTPIAIKNYADGKIWDYSNYEWIRYSLQLEEATLSLLPKKVFNNIKDKQLYDILEVSPDSTFKEIKKAYYQKAKYLHPDKVQGENVQQAEQDFKNLCNAYQILSNPISRDKYHELGIEGIKNTQTIDPTTFFELLFGSEQFEYFIGELQITAMMNNTNDYQELTEIQNNREIKIACNLAKLLSRPDLIEYLDDIIENLSKNPVGQMLLQIIANVYLEKALEYKSFFQGIFIKFDQRRQDIINTYNLANSAIKSYRNASKLESSEQDPTENEVLPFIETIINMTILDINQTLRNSCNKIFMDTSVSIEERTIRADTLLIVADKFKKHSVSKKKGIEYLKMTRFAQH